MENEKIEELKNLLFDPTAIQDKIYNILEDSTNGKINIPDPTGPFPFLMEAGAMVSSAVVHEFANNAKKMYPLLSTCKEDLYPNLTNDDLKDTYATPSVCLFTFYINKDNLLKNGYVSNSYTELVIPRLTEITVNDLNFVLTNDVSIKLYSTGKLFVSKIGFNSDISIANNVILPSGVTRDGNGIEWIIFETEIQQLKITKFIDNIMYNNIYEKTIATNDQYVSSEIKTIFKKTDTLELMNITYSDFVYNVDYPTVYVKPLEDGIKISIPPIYTLNNDISDSINVLLYTSKGKQIFNVQDYSPDAFKIDFKSYTEQNIKSTGISNISIFVKAVTHTYGGRDTIDFATLKSKVINYSIGDNVLPITDNELSEEASKLGFTIVRKEDSILAREYIASKKINIKDESKSLYIKPDIFSNKVSLTELNVDNDFIINKGNIMIINPFTTFKLKNNKLEPMLRNDVEAYNSSKIDNITNNNNEKLFYNIYKYILEYDDKLIVRSYDININKIDNFRDSINNEKMDIVILLTERQLTRNKDNYELQFKIIDNGAFKDMDLNKIKIEISLDIPNTQIKAYYYGNVTIVNDVLIGKVIIETTGYINNDDKIELKNFISKLSSVYVDLNTNISLMLYSTDTTMSPYETYLNSYLNDITGTAVFHKELMYIEFGTKINYLYNNYNLEYTNRKFLKHTELVYLTYDKTIYDNDENGIIVDYIDSDGDGTDDTAVPRILHNKGDYVLDANNEKIVKYNIGDVMLDEYNNPVIDTTYGIIHNLEILLLEYDYKLCTSDNYNTCLIDMYKQITNTLIVELENLNKKLLDNTVIRYLPNNNLNNVLLKLNNSIYSIPNFIEPKITLYTNNNVNDVNIINNYLKIISLNLQDGLLLKTNITIIEDNILKELDDNVVSVKITNIDNIGDLDIKKYADDSGLFVIDKILDIDNKGEYIVKPKIKLDIIEI